jgi:putative transposase
MKPARKREMVDHIRRAWQVSIRRACQALPVDRSTYHYRSKRSGQAVLMKRIKEIAETRVHYGLTFPRKSGHHVMRSLRLPALG